MLGLDPLSPIASSVTALSQLLVSRDLARSADLWRRVEELDPDFPVLVDYAAFTFIALGDWDEARARLKRLARSRADSVAFGEWVETAAAVRRGRTSGEAERERAFDAARRFAELSGAGELGAALLTGPVDPERALGIVHDLLDEPCYRHGLSMAGRFWFFDGLHDDARYRRWMRTLGLDG